MVLNYWFRDFFILMAESSCIFDNDLSWGVAQSLGLFLHETLTETSATEYYRKSYMFFFVIFLALRSSFLSTNDPIVTSGVKVLFNFGLCFCSFSIIAYTCSRFNYPSICLYRLNIFFFTSLDTSFRGEGIIPLTRELLELSKVLAGLTFSRRGYDGSSSSL